MNYLLFIVSIFISHLTVTILAYILFFNSFNLAAPFLFIYDLVRPVITAIRYKKIVTPYFEYSLHFTLLYLGIIFLPFLCSVKNDKKGKYGYARFITCRRTIKQMGFNFESGIVFGKLKNNIIKRLFTRKSYDVIRSNEPLSTLMIAPTGAGKTAGFIIPALESVKNSLVVFDIKGELYKLTHKKRQEMGHKILKLDPEDFKNSIKFNPFAVNQLPEKIMLPSYISNISNIIFAKKGDDRNDYFTNSTKDFFNTVALFLIYKKGYTTINEIKSLVVKDNDLATTFKQIQEELKEELEVIKDDLEQKIINKISEGIKRMVQIIEAKDQFSGVIGSFNTKLSLFNDFDIENITDCKKSTITAEALRQENITLYLSVKDNDIERLNPLISLFFESLTSDLISKEPSKYHNQVTFILDEFGNLGRVKKLIKATTISRSYKLNQIFVLQDLKQLSHIYSPEEKEILEANTAYKIILAQNNFETAKHISQMIGNKTETRSSESENKGKGNKSKSISKSDEGISLVTAQDIMNLDRNECLILTQRNYAKVINPYISWI